MSLYVVIMALAISFLITVLLCPIFIPFLRRLKFGQIIREEGPESHMKKSGTPTMGGVIILLSITITAIIMVLKFTSAPITFEFWLLIFILLGYGLVGFLDDFIKIAFKRNLGLTSKQKLIGQLLIAIIFYVILKMNDFPTYVKVPGTTLEWDLGWAYGILVVFMLIGSSNAVNLTDGLDGL